jgi:hypothetical protein
MLLRLIIAGFLLAHGALHASFLSPRPPVTVGGPAWPFDLGHSWALSPVGVQPDLIRLLGIALVAATVAGFALASFSALGIAPRGMWEPSIALGCIASGAVLIVFFHPWLVFGLAIDAALAWAAFSGWSPTPTDLAS